MATLRQCKKCIHHDDNCPILYAIQQQGIKADKILREKCISWKDKK